MVSRDEVVKRLRQLKPQLKSQFKVDEISLFGSFVREEQQSKSDIDVLVEFNADASFFDLVRLGLYLEAQLERKVDVIPEESLRVEIRDAVLRERVGI